MSNVFNQELQDAIKEVYSQLEAAELIQENLEKGAKLGLYFAHGATEKAGHKFREDYVKSFSRGNQLGATILASETSANIVTAATAAATDAKNTNSFASTAAVNIQAAANALTDLSADVAAILAVATSKDYGSKIQQLANMSYKLTQAASDNAENTTLQSLNTTIEAAQSRATDALTQAKTLSSDLTTLYNALNDNFEAIQDAITNDGVVLAAAKKTEEEQEGIYKTALVEEKAMEFSEQFINEQVNYDLRYIKTGNNGDQFQIAFNHFDEVKLMIENGELTPEVVISKYRVIFTQVDDAPAFDIQAAKGTTHYFEIPLSNRMSYEMDFVTAEYAANNPGNNSNIARDNTGQAVQRGTPYVVFVYAVYTCDYQNQMENTDGFLSLGSLPFTLLTDLPAANKPLLNFYQDIKDAGSKCSISDAVRVLFSVENLMYQGVDLSEIMEFKVFLFSESNEMASNVNLLIDQKLKKLFEADEAYRLAEEAYLKAEQSYNAAIAIGASEEVIAAKKNVLAAAELNYQIKTRQYNQQQAMIDSLNKAKKSSFFLDQDILASIPDAFGLTAKKIDGLYLTELQEKLEASNIIKEAIELEQVELENLRSVLSGQITENQSLNDNAAIELNEQNSALNSLVDNLHQRENLTRELIQEFLHIDNLPELIERLNELPFLLEDLEELVAEFTFINEVRAAIASLEHAISGREAIIERDQRELGPINEQRSTVIEKHHSISNTIEILNIEIGQIEALSSSVSGEELSVMRTRVADLNAMIEIVNTTNDDPDLLGTLRDRLIIELQELLGEINLEQNTLEKQVKKMKRVEREISKFEKAGNEPDKLKAAKEKQLKLEEEMAALKSEMKILVSATGEEINETSERIRILELIIAEMEPTVRNVELLLAFKQSLEEERTGLEEAISSIEISATSNLFIAIDETGAFTDNYGEPLMREEKYSALIYSVIKPTEPSALPLFQPTFSPYSNSERFFLPQI